MPRRKFSDHVKGTIRSVQQKGLIGATNPIVNYANSKAVMKERLAKERAREFGSGAEGAGGDRTWYPPVYTELDNGRKITISFHRTRPNDYLVADGHVSIENFYHSATRQNHDHFMNGKIVADRGRSS